MEESILLARDEAWTVLRVIERVVDAGERSGNVDPDASEAFRLVASKLLPDLFPDE